MLVMERVVAALARPYIGRLYRVGGRAEFCMTSVLEGLAEMIASRRGASGETSYTRELLDGGPELCAKKLGEEAIETVIAGVSQSDKALEAEAADLLYHLLVLLESRGVKIADVLAVLEARRAQSGIAEKASRAMK